MLEYNASVFFPSQLAIEPESLGIEPFLDPQAKFEIVGLKHQRSFRGRHRPDADRIRLPQAVKTQARKNQVQTIGLCPDSKGPVEMAPNACLNPISRTPADNRRDAQPKLIGLTAERAGPQVQLDRARVYRIFA